MCKRSLLIVSVLCFVIASCTPQATVIVTVEIVSSITPTTQPPTIDIVVTDTAPQLTGAVTETSILSTTQPASSTDTTTPILETIAGEHRVAPGETLSCIGRAYGVLPKAIADTNGIEVTSVLNVGQVLKIPRIQWINMPAGPVCATQFTSPFPGLPVTSSSTQPPSVATPTATLQFPPTPTDTDRPIPMSPTSLSFTATLQLPPTPTDTDLPIPVTASETSQLSTATVTPSLTPSATPHIVTSCPTSTPLPFPVTATALPDC